MSSPRTLSVDIEWLQQMRDAFDRRLAEAQERYHEVQFGAGPQSIRESLLQPPALYLPVDTTRAQKQSLTIPQTPVNTAPLSSPATASEPFGPLETSLPSMPQFLATSQVGPPSARSRRSSSIFSDSKLPAPSERTLSDAVVERVEITSPRASITSLPIPSQVKMTDPEMETLLSIPLKTDSRETALAIMASGRTWKEVKDLAWGIGQAVNAGSLPRFLSSSKAPAAQDREQIGASVEKSMDQCSTGVALKTVTVEAGGTSNMPANETNLFLPKDCGKLKYEGTATTSGLSMMPLNTSRAFQNVFTKTAAEIQCQLRTDNQKLDAITVPENFPNIVDNDEQDLRRIQPKEVNTDQSKSNIMLSTTEELQPYSDIKGKNKANTAQGKPTNMWSVPGKEQNALGSTEKIQMKQLWEGIQNVCEEEERQNQTLDSYDSENAQTGEGTKCEKIGSTVVEEKTTPVDTPRLAEPLQKSEIEVSSPYCSGTSSLVLRNNDGKGLPLPYDSTTKPSIVHTGAQWPKNDEAVGSRTREYSTPIQATTPLYRHTGFRHQHGSRGSNLLHMTKTPNSHIKILPTLPENITHNGHAATLSRSQNNSPTPKNTQTEWTDTSFAKTSEFCGNSGGSRETSCTNESATVCSKPGDRRASRPCNGRFAARALRGCLRPRTTTNPPTPVESLHEPADANPLSLPLPPQHLAMVGPNSTEIATLEQLFQNSTDTFEPEKSLIRIPHFPAAIPTVANADVTPKPIIPWESRALREAPPHIRAKAKLARGRYVDILGNGVNVCAGSPVPQVPGAEWCFAQTRL